MKTMKIDKTPVIRLIRRNESFCRAVASVSAALFLLISAAPAVAGTMVLAGNGTGGAVLKDGVPTGVSLTGDGTFNCATFSTSAKSAVLDWSAFNIGQNQSMSFNGAETGTTFFNLVDSGLSRSVIDGSIIGDNANVWVINPAGIAFGANATVNVDGLFAAAAGKISNPEDLRNGTATLPAFDSFAGTVDVQGGTFTADRVALLGKTVKVDGVDMKNVGQLAIGAADGMTVVDTVVVDTVEDGKVSINVTDFAADADETSVLLGDLDLGGGVDLGLDAPLADRGLIVQSGNGIKVTGEVNTDGNAELYTKNGSVTVTESGQINAKGIGSEIGLIAGMDPDGRGDVVVDGSVKADSGMSKYLQESGLDALIERYGCSAQESVYAYAGYGAGDDNPSSGDVTVGGLVKASGDLLMRSYDNVGSVEIGKSGALVSRYGAVKMIAGSSVKSAGAVAAGNGIVYATGIADGVDLNVDDSGLVVALAVSAQTVGDAAVAVDNPRNVITDISLGWGLSEKYSSPQAVFAVDPLGYTVDQAVYDLIGGVGFGNAIVWDDISDSGDLSLCSYLGDMTVLKGVSLSAKSIYLGADGDINVGSQAALTASGTDPVYGTSIDLESSGKIQIGKGATLRAMAADSMIRMTSDATDSAKGGIVVDGDISACVADHSGNGMVYLKTERGDIDVSGNLEADGAVSALTGSIDYLFDENRQPVKDENGVYVEIGRSGGGDIRVNGTITAKGAPDKASIMVESINEGNVVISENGQVASTGSAIVSGADDVTVKGLVKGNWSAAVLSDNGDIEISGLKGKVVAEGEGGMAFVQGNGDVTFSAGGTLTGKDVGAVIAKGNLVQKGVTLPYKEGRVDSVSLNPAVSGKEVHLEIGGSIGGGKDNPFVVDGKTYAVAFGDMSLAVGNGHSLEGGDNSSVAAAKDSARYSIDSARKMLEGTLTLEETLARMANPSDFDDNGLLYAAGDMNLYTAGQMDANSYIGSGRDMTVSAAKFGDMSYLDVGGTLTINNVGASKTPQIAYFESVDGKEPRINNQPNDAVIFVDGRLAGGNLNIINKFGATEAFPVDAPELKSEQGIFGNPVFMHGDLDVANPMAVGNVDYMLQEIPRLTLASDFPLEVDKSVNTAGLNPKDVYRFGQHPQVADEKPQPEQEENKDDKASSEQPAEPKVASL